MKKNEAKNEKFSPPKFPGIQLAVSLGAAAATIILPYILQSEHTSFVSILCVGFGLLSALFLVIVILMALGAYDEAYARQIVEYKICDLEGKVEALSAEAKKIASERDAILKKIHNQNYGNKGERQGDGE